MKIFFQRILSAYNCFTKNKSTTYAASSAFFLLLTIIPVMLLLIRLIGLIIGDVSKSQGHLFSVLEKAFIDFAPTMLNYIKGNVRSLLYAHAHFTWFNFILLIITSMAFFNSIWNALFLITEDRRYHSFKKYIKGILLIGVGVIIIILSIALPTILMFVLGYLKSNTIFYSLNSNLFQMVIYLDSLTRFVIRSDIINFVLFVSYFTFLFAWMFYKKIKIVDALVGAMIFAISFVMGKMLFWYYFINFKKNLMHSYGSFYSFFIGIMWIYVVMIFFYFSVAYCHQCESKKYP